MILILFGCIPKSAFNEEYISGKIQDRTGYVMNPVTGDTIFTPPGVLIEDGLTVDESVSLALLNNQQLKVDFSALGFARADLIEAGVIPNPVFSLLFPLGPKQLEFSLSYYAEVIWQRPAKVSAAKLNTEKVAESLVNNGLALIRDVKINFAELTKLEEQVQILNETSELSREIEIIAGFRKDANDISELEETAFRINSSQAKEAALVAGKNMELQKTRFLMMIGLPTYSNDVRLIQDQVPVGEIPEMDSLIKIALAYRPDMRAAEIEVEMAGEKLGWERSKIFNLTAILDANAQGTEGFEMGPGLALSIPIFNTNQGGRARAKTEMIRSADNYILVQQSITGEVRDSWFSYLASKENYNMLYADIVKAAELAADRAESAYLLEEISYLEYLDFRRQFLDARIRLSESDAELRKSLANLYYSIGGELYHVDEKTQTDEK